MARRKPTLTYAPKGMVLTDTEFDDLHQRLAKVRKNSRTVVVSTEGLRHLLNDHGLLYARLDEVDRHLRAPAGQTLSEPARPSFTGASEELVPVALAEDEEDLIG